jgi:signal transduction histidine kinase
MQTASVADLDACAGTKWLAAVGAADRLQLLDALVHRFSHDLRTPLNTVAGWSHLLQNGVADATRIEHAADVIARNVHEQTLLLAHFVEDCRIVAGRLDVAAGSTDAASLFRQAVEQPGAATPHSASMAESDGGTVRRLIERIALVCARRARADTSVDRRTAAEPGWCQLVLSTWARADDWSAPDLLELRLATLAAAQLGGSIEMRLTESLHLSVSLRLPSEAVG